MLQIPTNTKSTNYENLNIPFGFENICLHSLKSIVWIASNTHREVKSLWIIAVAQTF